MSPKPWTIMHHRPADPFHTFGVRGVNEPPDAIHETRVRRGPFLKWRAFRKIDRMMRDA